MSNTKRNIILILKSLIGIILIVSSFIKILAVKTTIDHSIYGFDELEFRIIGVIELICVLLFLINRTGVIGTLLVVTYLGGSIATHIEFNENFLEPFLLEILVFITAFLSYPELLIRLFNIKKIEQ